MFISINDILLMPEFSKCNLISGQSGVNKLVKSINSMEVPDITDWLSEGELLITTGYSIKDDPKKMEDLIISLSNKNCAGLAIKTRFIKKINNNVLDLSNKLKIPIILMPDKLSFSELSIPIMKKITEFENLENKISMNIYEKFMNIEFDSLNIYGILDLISNMIGFDLIILDQDFNPYIYNDSSLNTISIINNNLDLFNDNGYTYLSESNLSFFTKQIIVKGKIMAYILVPKLSPDKYSSNIKIVLEQSSKILALELFKQEYSNESTFELNNNFFREILSKNLFSIEQIENKAASLNWPLFPYTIICFQLNIYTNSFKNKNNAKMKSLINEIYILINEEFYKHDNNVKITFYNDNFYLILNANTYYKKNLEKFIPTVISKIYDSISLKPRCIISDNIDDFYKIPDKINQLEKILSINNSNKDNRAYIYEKDTLIEQFFLNNIDSYYLKQFIENSIGKITNEKLNDPLNMYNTLYEYLKTGCNSLQTADNLFIHRNTLRYRINKIEQLLNCNLNSFENRAKITLAIQLNELYKYN